MVRPCKLYDKIGYMQFKWDREKAKKNDRKHKVSFDEAMTVYYDPLSATFDNPVHSVDEQRLITVGYSSRGRLVGLVFMPIARRLWRKWDVSWIG